MKRNAVTIKWASGFEYESNRSTTDTWFVFDEEEISSVELSDNKGWCCSSFSVFMLVFTTRLLTFLSFLSTTKPAWNVTDATSIQANWHQNSADGKLTSVYASIFTTANIIIRTAATIVAGHVYCSRCWLSRLFSIRPMMAPESMAERMTAKNQNSIVDVAKLYDDTSKSTRFKGSPQISEVVSVATDISPKTMMTRINNWPHSAILISCYRTAIHHTYSIMCKNIFTNRIAPAPYNGWG